MVRKTLYYETSNSLAHHGIKGMRWGVRRFQNKDGTLTTKGKKRYAEDPEDISKLSNEELRARVNRMRNEKRYYELTRTGGRWSKYSNNVDTAVGLGKDAVKTKKSAVALNEDDKNIRKQKLANYKMAGEGLTILSKSNSIAKTLDSTISDYKDGKKANKKVSIMSDTELNEIVQRLDLEKQYSDYSKETANRGRINKEKVINIIRDVGTIAGSALTVAAGVKALMDLGIVDIDLSDMKIPGM